MNDCTPLTRVLLAGGVQRGMRFGVCSTLLLVAVAGCGGKATTSPLADSGAGSDGSTGQDAEGPWSPVCPDSAPAEGSPCSNESLSCEYGCGNVLVCAGGTWGGAVGTPPYAKPAPILRAVRPR